MISKCAKNVLLVGSNSKWAIERHFVKYMTGCCNLFFFNARGIFLNYYYANYLNKIFFRLGISSIISQINKELLEIVKKRDFDAILVFKGMEIYPETLDKLKQSGIMLFNYNPDHPYEFFGSGSGNENVEKGIKLYHHHFSYSQAIIKGLKENYAVSCTWVPFGYEKSHPPSTEKDIRSICFIGNPDKDRAKTINNLLQNDIEVDVYGNGWDNFLIRNDGLKCFDAIYGDDFIRIAQMYRVQLNTFRPHNYGSHNMRTFEMPAIGCIMLAPYSEEHSLLYDNKKEVFFYESEEELIGMAKLILALEDEQAFEIKKKAHQRSVLSNYNYAQRAEIIMTVINKKLHEEER
ncbi:glycosyltransferase [Vicingaceae bacterium]|nr:glycosyltransferase [Vicingaceae bacterium]MDB4060485.1 glycosyltransferase [Vicingaceae bacterium]